MADKKPTTDTKVVSKKPTTSKVMLINTGTTNAYVDLDGNELTDDIVIIGPSGNAKVVLSDERISAIKKTHPKIAIKKLGV